MRYISSRPVLAGCFFLALVLSLVALGWWLVRPSRPRHSWDEVQVGVTTDAELGAWFGPPVQVGPSWLFIEGERITTICKHWWREDHSDMEVMINEKGVVVSRQHGLCMPTQFELWWRQLIEKVFD